MLSSICKFVKLVKHILVSYNQENIGIFSLCTYKMICHLERFFSKKNVFLLSCRPWTFFLKKNFFGASLRDLRRSVLAGWEDGETRGGGGPGGELQFPLPIRRRLALVVLCDRSGVDHDFVSLLLLLRLCCLGRYQGMLRWMLWTRNYLKCRGVYKFFLFLNSRALDHPPPPYIRNPIFSGGGG